jgi:putative nucleotidyltransferase with HDIG domain
MKLAHPILDKKRRALLTSGQTIPVKYKALLQEKGIGTVVINDAISDDITLQDRLDLSIWYRAVEVLEKTFEHVEMDRPLPIRAIQDIVGDIYKDILHKVVNQILPRSLVVKEWQLFGHAVNVTSLALQTGKRLGYNEKQLRDLATGCLLHDIGKGKVGNEREHAEIGFQILRKERALSLLSAHVAFQHHEAINGTGYPREINGNSFLEYAQICSIANEYEHLVSDDQMEPYEALEVVKQEKEVIFSQSVLEAFLRAVPPFPEGHILPLSRGEKAIVIRNTLHVERPLLKKLFIGETVELYSANG